MSGPGDDEEGKGKPPGSWPPDAEYAVPTGSPDVYDPGYVPPPADPAHDDSHASEVPPAELYPTAGTYPWSEKPAPRASKSGKVAAPTKTTPSSKSGPVAKAPAKPAAPSKTAATPPTPAPNPPPSSPSPAPSIIPPATLPSPSPSANLPSPASYVAPQNVPSPPSAAGGDATVESGDATAGDFLAQQGDFAAGGAWTPPTGVPPPSEWQTPPQEPTAGEWQMPAQPAVIVVAEEPLLPPELAADGALNDAVGAPSARARRRARTQPRRDGDDGDDDGLAPPRNRRTMIIATLSIVVGLGIATLVFLGRANAQRYVLTCDSAHAVPEQGRGFPPWGSRPLHGPEWTPIALPANAECQPRETDDVNELGKWYLELLLDRANVTLTARDLLDSVGSQATANPLDLVAAQLDQALLLARDPDRRDQRRDITRLQGDVAYWRAAARLRDASTVLVDAAKQFDTANQQHPRHATDAAAWSSFLHHLADELHAGPNGVAPIAPATATNAAVTGTTPVPVGTALPVEPDSGSAGSAVPPPTPDAGIPSGGVLL
jgi:hypothetical protein